MTVTVTRITHPSRGDGVRFDFSADDDVAQANIHIGPGYPDPNWDNGDVSFQKPQGMRVTRTNAGTSAFARDNDGHSATAGWEPWSEPGATIVHVRDPVSGLRFYASAADQSVTLWTRYPLADDSASGITFA